MIIFSNVPGNYAKSALIADKSLVEGGDTPDRNNSTSEGNQNTSDLSSDEENMNVIQKSE
jgi:hypothetical protein